MIRQRNGIEITTTPPIVMDGTRDNAKAHIVSHAHADHLPRTDQDVICSSMTGKLMAARTGQTVETRPGTETITLHESGHIIGSRAAEVQVKDTTVLYTGDVSIQDRLYLDGFDPPDADILVTEATYGIPNYRFPDQNKVVDTISDWIEDTPGSLILFGYSLGKAQKIQTIAQNATQRDIYVHGSIANMNEVIEKHSDRSFDVEPYKDNKDRLDDSIIVLPSRLSRKDWVQSLVEKLDATTAGFSGWAQDDSYVHRRGIDEGFPLSDHCDFDDLGELVEQVDPETVYTQHGFDDALASHLRDTIGVRARSLKKNQTTLDDF